MASLEPDGQNFLHVCQNPANIDLEILHLLAEKIELRHPHLGHLGDVENIEFDRDDEMEAPAQSFCSCRVNNVLFDLGQAGKVIP